MIIGKSKIQRDQVTNVEISWIRIRGSSDSGGGGGVVCHPIVRGVSHDKF